MQLVYLYKGLELAPDAVMRVVDQVPESAWDEKRDPARFTFREAIAHHADWEPINLDRIHKGVTEPGCTVPGFDEGQFAIDRNYAARDPHSEARRFVEDRKKTIEYLKSLTDEDWEKVFYHSERGRQTVLEQVVTILGHDMYHLEQYTQYF